jgi:hypothetical protein
LVTGAGYSENLDVGSPSVARTWLNKGGEARVRRRRHRNARTAHALLHVAEAVRVGQLVAVVCVPAASALAHARNARAQRTHAPVM